ncbi:hypothetical protein D7X33_18385 [Butyricicoccus sp. 1XD8-22]|nr:hypothetical protein D7X33_18385 [Butyricicoccus sp. 1XD8-22]
MITGTKKYTVDNQYRTTSMIYDRKEFSGWVVEVVGMSDEEKFVGVFRTAVKDGIECEQFTLLPAQYSDNTIVQIRIYNNGNILTFGVVPVNTVIFKRKKVIEVQLMCELEIDESGEFLITMPDEFY